MTNTTEPNVSITATQKRIIKINQCPTLSNNSTLTYHIGCDGKDNCEDDSIYFRIIANTKAGLFNDEWISLSDIQ